MVHIQIYTQVLESASFAVVKIVTIATEKGKRFTHPDYSRSLRKSGEELKVET